MNKRTGFAEKGRADVDQPIIPALETLRYRENKSDTHTTGGKREREMLWY